MFAAVGQSLEGDHLDLSYRDTGSWTRVGPGFDVPSLWVSLGDAVAGPTVQLGACPPLPMQTMRAASIAIATRR